MEIDKKIKCMGKYLAQKGYTKVGKGLPTNPYPEHRVFLKNKKAKQFKQELDNEAIYIVIGNRTRIFTYKIDLRNDEIKMENFDTSDIRKTVREALVTFDPDYMELPLMYKEL